MTENNQKNVATVVDKLLALMATGIAIAIVGSLLYLAWAATQSDVATEDDKLLALMATGIAIALVGSLLYRILSATL